jgi:hypothetical protein
MRNGQRFRREAHHAPARLPCWRQVGARLAEVLEVGRGEHQHLAGAVVAQQVVALAGRTIFGPALEVGQLLALGFWVNRL